MSYIETDLDGINSLLGGIPRASILGITGKPKAGKTIFTAQAAYEVLRDTPDKNAVIIDTEGSLPTHREWAAKYNDRYDLDVDVVPLWPDTQGNLKADADTNGQTLYVATVPDIETILALHGRPAELENKGSKLEIKQKDGWNANPWESPLGRWLRDHDCTFLAYDSVTMPLQVFGSNRQNFPARSDATMWWLLAAQILTQRLQLVTICTNHQTVSPGGFDRAQVTGGKAVTHNTKYLLHLVHKSKNDKHTPSPPVKFRRENDHGRYVWLTRHPSRPDWSRCVLLNLTSGGFVDYER